MDHPIMADLKAARAKGWERLRLLIGQRAYLTKHPEVLTGLLQERVARRQVIEDEIKELIGLLAPGSSLEFASYEPGDESGGLRYTAASENGFNDGEYKWIACVMTNPIEPPIAEPAADRPDDSDPTDLLKALEG